MNPSPRPPTSTRAPGRASAASARSEPVSTLSIANAPFTISSSTTPVVGAAPAQYDLATRSGPASDRLRQVVHANYRDAITPDLRGSLQDRIVTATRG